MQITLTIPDDLPTAIVQQYIKTIEAQMTLMRKLSSKNIDDKILKFTGNDFNPAEHKKGVWLGIEEWRKSAQFDEMGEELTDEIIASWRDKSSGRDFSWNS